MRWSKQDKSRNVDDRRGKNVKTGVGIGLGTIVIFIIATLLGEDPGRLMEQLPVQQQTQQTQSSPRSAAEDELADFVGAVLTYNEEVWDKLFQEQLGRTYQKPVLVLFTDKVQTACGLSGAATGPFYCPGDQKLYIDLSFYQELKNRFKAPGDFAMAYVVAHEVGHHVQYLLGITQEVHQKRNRIAKAEYNRLSVCMELQADFLAGVWAHHAHQARNILEEGDIEEALRAAHAIGDDHIQMQSRGYVVPESFTHGTSEQRMRWFKKGIQTGDLRQGDTFAAKSL
ncbi:MAG: neutral zinc metallopeptidase [Saprospiraceae bacterium]